METVLILGGAGFIGSHLSDYLLDKGYRVVCMDNLLTGDISNISHLFESDFARAGNYQFIKYDVTDYIHLKGDLHYILNFASPASPVD